MRGREHVKERERQTKIDWRGVKCKNNVRNVSGGIIYRYQELLNFPLSSQKTGSVERFEHKRKLRSFITGLP